MDVSPVLRLLAARRLAKLDRMDPAETQQRTLLGLVGRAAQTRFGRDHDFAGVRSVADFQARVPIRQFEDLWADYFKAPWPILDNVSWPGRIPFFAKTSGTTTGRTKYIPITREIIKSNERTGFDLMTYHMTQTPGSRPLSRGQVLHHRRIDEARRGGARNLRRRRQRHQYEADAVLGQEPHLPDP